MFKLVLVQDVKLMLCYQWAWHDSLCTILNACW